MAQAVSFSHSLGPKPTNFVACGWSGIEGSPDFVSVTLRPPLVTRSGHLAFAIMMS
jgi:hypothetical protein